MLQSESAMHFQTSMSVLVVLVPLVLGAVRPIGPVSGGIGDVDTNDETVQQMARFAVAELGSSYSLVSVEKAGKQVVAGLMYHMTVNVEKVSTDGTKSFSCDVKVLSQDWMGVLELNAFSCQSA